MYGTLKISLLSRLPGHASEMSIPDQDYWGAALPLLRDADRDAALANVRRRFPDALIEIPGQRSGAMTTATLAAPVAAALTKKTLKHR